MISSFDSEISAESSKYEIEESKKLNLQKSQSSHIPRMNTLNVQQKHWSSPQRVITINYCEKYSKSCMIFIINFVGKILDENGNEWERRKSSASSCLQRSKCNSSIFESGKIQNFDQR